MRMKQQSSRKLRSNKLPRLANPELTPPQFHEVTINLPEGPKTIRVPHDITTIQYKPGTDGQFFKEVRSIAGAGELLAKEMLALKQIFGVEIPVDGQKAICCAMIRNA